MCFSVKIKGRGSMPCPHWNSILPHICSYDSTAGKAMWMSACVSPAEQSTGHKGDVELKDAESVWVKRGYFPMLDSVCFDLGGKEEVEGIKGLEKVSISSITGSRSGQRSVSLKQNSFKEKYFPLIPKQAYGYSLHFCTTSFYFCGSFARQSPYPNTLF